MRPLFDVDNVSLVGLVKQPAPGEDTVPEEVIERWLQSLPWHRRWFARFYRALRKLNAGEDPRQVIEALSQGITNKLMHPPTHALNHASEAERNELSAMLTRLYQIPRQE